MSSTLKNIVIVGASGVLGNAVLSTLLSNPFFVVTVLSRPDSKATFPSAAKVIKLDYHSKDALVFALRGQDAVISCLGFDGLNENLDQTLIEASIAAGVKRFLPSEFSANTFHDTVVNLPVYTSKVAIHKVLEDHKDQISYTYVFTGGFLDWGFRNGFLGFDIKNRSVILYDDGKYRASGTTLQHIGEAIKGILLHPEETRNRPVYLADATFSQKEALALFEKYTGTKWTIMNKTTEEALKSGLDALAKGDYINGYGNIIMSFNWGGKGAVIFDNNDMTLLDVKPLGLEKIIKDAVEEFTK
ncbi:unnamed protein product [Didymodactylos carnosus]|uniref:NmrA-like domain-containing protein n=1 Tax=Didymodactylos carnosus TaxID=1234261 RepID=A0A816DN18_9BILA|nr:unnamed protein product [Didymodactylos carnosus]CAF1635078.1 unnamed protein product [Didymodactylos carnosus]CAF4138294.1 unnamed protein product [Didymodactylos carnosus]CAF4539212.1 unnamed protein product [Didymodactylos carnosus]